jgi:hypothetical protein
MREPFRLPTLCQQPEHPFQPELQGQVIRIGRLRVLQPQPAFVYHQVKQAPPWVNEQNEFKP